MFKIILSSGFLATAVAFGGVPALIITFSFLAGLWVIWAVQKWAYVRVSEVETAVLFHIGSGNFSRFLGPGRHWVLPFAEKMSHTIPTSPGTVNGTCTQAETSGGIPLTIEWSLSYKLNPFKISPNSRPKLARNLPKKAAMIATKHLNHALRHVLSEYAVADLSQPGTVKRLEREVRQQALARLSSLGFEISRVMLGVIEMPASVRSALAASYEQKVRTENEAASLARLHQVVSQFSDGDMQRLMELERIYKL
ncbi:MAG: SPFH domain-containing protein, partial [Anaerolineae bacterium]